MLGAVFRGIIAIAATYCILLLHLGISYAFPYPFNTIDALTIAAVVYIVTVERGSIVWYGAIGYFLFESVSGSSFGVYLLAGTLSILLGYWLHAYVVTNQAWHGVVLVTTTIVLSKLILLILISAVFFDVSLTGGFAIIGHILLSAFFSSIIALAIYWGIIKTSVYRPKRLYSSYE